MNKKRFFERYKDMFHTSTFEDTYKEWTKLSDETKKQLRLKALSESGKAWHSIHKKEFSAAMMCHKVSDETRKKISSANKKYYSNQENRLKTSEAIKKAFKENPRNLESFKKQAESLKKTYANNPLLKERISTSLKNYYSDPIHRKEISEKTKTAMHKFYMTEKGQENLKKWTDGSRAKGTSTPEKELQDFVKSLTSDVIFNTRSILGDGKELDVYVPSKNVAIEYNGNIWHSEAYKKDKAERCQLDKTLLCEQKGIRLLHIFSDEWAYKKDIVKSLIKSSLGIYGKKYMARKLRFEEIPMKAAAQFFVKNHIQGNAPANCYFGLYDKDELIQCISIGKNRFNKEKNLELIRMATKLNCQVVGGFSKLIKKSLKYLGADKIESYIDRRLFNGNGYKAAGFVKIGESGPRYFYTDGSIRENRQVYMKQSCLKKWPECTPDMTEHEMCLQHGLYRIYDCGTEKVAFQLTN